jgi:hypothetical protein
MREIRLRPIHRLGFDFVDGAPDSSPPPFGTDKSDWRGLKQDEISGLESRGNRADDWTNITVREGFAPERVENCRFFGPVRIGSLSASYLEYHDLRLPVGLYSCTLVSCDIGSDVAMHNVRYISRTVVGARCLLFNIDEIVTTDHAKFGNGIVMDGEDEDVRIWLEIANENGGRRVLPFDGLLPADAWIWSKYRDDNRLMDRFVDMTSRIKGRRRGGYGSIGEETIIKDCRILKDVLIGSNAYIKGCNKLKNLTINSDAERPTQLGEGCELVNGIIGYGCRVFYGVKAVRFVLCDHSNLKYGARLINSILGPNSTISCCEVLNSLIFGSHEQHHNSSFLCASVLKGQTNMASAATVGSNHNSRSADGEIVADRGFWPGLSVSLKHNSRFAAFTLIAKGSYPAELDIPLPFSLVSNDVNAGELVLMPGYWFRYNMYALARNAAKASARDKRIEKHQFLEFDWLAPDTVDQMREARLILESWSEGVPDDSETLYAGATRRIENSSRPVKIVHAGRAWRDYGRMIRLYAVRTLIEGHEGSAESWLADAPSPRTAPEVWQNLGGQLIPESRIQSLKEQVKNGEIQDWAAMHRAYKEMGEDYDADKRTHALRILKGMREEFPEAPGDARGLLTEALEVSTFILEGIRNSRRKDYENPFRNITYDGEGERDAVIGRFEENTFILDAQENFEVFTRKVKKILDRD